jgi:hypothetical protein
VTTMNAAFRDSGLQSCPSWAVGKGAEGPCP